MSEQEIEQIIEQLKQLPLSTKERIETLNKLLDEKQITNKEPYIKKLIEQ